MEYQALPVGIDAMALERQLAYGTEPWGDVDLEAWETILQCYRQLCWGIYLETDTKDWWTVNPAVSAANRHDADCRRAALGLPLDTDPDARSLQVLEYLRRLPGNSTPTKPGESDTTKKEPADGRRHQTARYRPAPPPPG